jgi:uncharacterized protein
VGDFNDRFAARPVSGDAAKEEHTMTYGFMSIALTPSVRAAQAEMGAEDLWVDFRGDRAFDRFTANEKAFIADRDSFYMASVSEKGWPYVQHRGGPPGFLKMLDEQTLAFLDYRGNRQYISTGNFKADDRACLILVDYARRARLKIFVHVETLSLEAHGDLKAELTDAHYRAVPERIFRLRLEAFDWNCPQHIAPRFTAREISTATHPLHERIATLEEENAALRRTLDALTNGAV